jgi:hypothetical protein
VTPLAQAKYGVTVVEQNKQTNFSALKTYSWTDTQTAVLSTVDKLIIAAVDRELQLLGLTKAAQGPGDVIVNHQALRRSDVDTKSAPSAAGTRDQISVGSLTLRLLDSKTRSRILELRLDKPIDTTPGQAEAVINQAVTELFTKYPTKTK